MKKNLILMIIIIFFICLLGIGIGYFFYENSNKQDNNKIYNAEYVVSTKTINELAKKNKYIDNNFANKVEFFITYEELKMINNQDVYLTVENEKLYLVSNSYKEYDSNIDDYIDKKGIEYKSLISNMDESVVMIRNLASGECAAENLEYGILTENGNLYRITFEDNTNNYNEIMTALSQNKEINLIMKKVNKDDIKILAFTKYEYDSRDITCGSRLNPLYASDNTLRDYDTFEVVKPIIDYIVGSLINFDVNYQNGFVIYDNLTISVDNKNVIKNKDNKNLIINSYYNDESLNKILIIDNKSNIYYQLKVGKDIKLLKEEKIKKISKEIVSYGETSYEWDDKIKFTFTLENNESIIITVDYYNYKTFE